MLNRTAVKLFLIFFVYLLIIDIFHNIQINKDIVGRFHNSFNIFYLSDS